MLRFPHNVMLQAFITDVASLAGEADSSRAAGLASVSRSP